MALRAVLDHPKFADLKARLQQPRGAALGWLEAVWHFAGRFTPQGNIGKYSDAAIEAWVEWNGEPGRLIAILTETKWIDADSTHRLLVHDWNDHADVMVHTSLARGMQKFANGALPDSGRLNQKERERFNVWLEENGLHPKHAGRPAKSQPKSSQNSDCLTESTAEIPKPEPEPVPEPVPGPAPAPPAAPPPEPIRPNVVPFIPPPDPDAGAELALAHWLLEEISVPADTGTRKLAAEAIRLLAKEGGTMQTAAEYIAQQAVEARCRGETINRFWFTDQRYRPNVGKSRKQADKESRRKAFIEGGD